MTIRHLRIFVAVVTAGKMCDAADQLFLSQPTVSQAIKELEEHYEVLLFERLGKKLYITDAGEKLLKYAKNILTEFDNIEKRMLEMSSKKSLSIGATITIGNCILPYAINDIKEVYPDIHTSSCISNTKVIEEKLLTSELDIAMIEGNISDPNLVSIPFLKDSLVLACNSKHKLAKKEELTIEDLKNTNFVFREKGSGTRELFEDYIQKSKIPINVVLQSNCPGSIKNAILINNFASVISIRLIEQEILNGDITIFRCSKNLLDRTFKIVYHKDKFIDSVMNNFINMLKNYEDSHKLDNLPSKKLLGFK
ncbi:MAG: LysR family transcriptional regulator [Clostridiaceae bacterium]|nr:LysR family transcriptional regulator [Clostridiaceae bacterium]MBW4860435.1 LysR family transcriptional regulator [Clostridiaceae bacterium]MBW4868351.1 LysR family transcriptional regulator [Clostridiaceae bacterium]